MKTNNLLIIAIACLGFVTTITAQSATSNLPTNGLEACYSFTGNADDESGGENNGVVNGATLTAGKDGALNTAYYFDGTGNTIDFASPFFEGNQVNEFTFHVRVKLNDISNSPNIWGKTFFWGEVNLKITDQGSTNLTWANNISGNKYSRLYTNNNVINENVWYDIVVVYHNSGGQIFIDGQPVQTNLRWISQGGSVISTSQIEASCNFAQDTNSSKIGSRITSGIQGSYLNGIIDQFCLWDRPLSQQEIIDITGTNCSEVSITASAAEVCTGESVDLSVDGLISSSGVNTQSHSFTTGNYTRIPYTPHLYNLPQSTIEFWYYQESSSEEFIVATEYFNTGWGFHVENNGSSPRFLEWKVSNGAARLGFDIPDRYEIPFNQWIHVAGVHDGSTVYLYVDGNLIDSAPYTGQIGDSYEDIVINRHTWASGSSERLNGKIDELRISDIARYTSNFTPPVYEFNNDSNTLALWHFNGNMQDESQYNTQSATNGTNFSSNVPFGSYNLNSTDLLWSTGETTETITVSPAETTEYWVDVTTNGVTCREYITIDVTAPAAPTGDSEQTFCEASTVADLTATGDNIQWYDAASGGNLLDSTTALTDGQMVYASQTVNGCESTDRLEVTVSIQDITITASATEVCAGESVDLTVSTDSSTDFTANLQNGLVAYWPFSGNANDVSGNGNNGTVNGATLTTDRFGNADSAYYFSSIGCSTRIDANVNTTSIQSGLTISLWLNRQGNGCINPRLFEFWPGSDGPGKASCSWNSQNPNIRMRNITSSDVLNLTAPISPNNQWIHIVYTNDGINGKFYKDGILTDSTTSSGDVILAGNLAIGRMNHPAWDAWNGKIDDFALWNRALSETEVQQLAGTPSYTWSTGDTTSNISVTPTETTEYWVDVTTNGVTCREYITINVTAPAAPTADINQSFNNGDTLDDLIITGTNLQWYVNSSDTNPIPSSTTLVNETTYYVSQTVNGCESERLAINVTETLGVDEIDLKEFNLYPNPTNDILYFNSSQIINKIRVYNTVGQLLSEHLFNDSNGEINVNELESGVYFIKINNQVKSYTIIKH